MHIVGDLEKFTNLIVEKAREEARNIVAKAKEKAEEIMRKTIEETRRRAESEALEIVRKRREEALSRKRSEIAKARTEMSKKLLDHKERLIEKVVEEAKKRIQNVENKEYRERLVEMIKEAVRVLGGGVIEIKLNRRDMRLGLDLTAIAKELTQELGEPVELIIANETGDFIGGFIARSLKVGIEVDYTIEGILERKWKKLRSEIARLLFSES